MPIPDADLAYVPPQKLHDYLLDEEHPVGGSKAKFLRELGFDPNVASALERELLKLVQTSDSFSVKASPFGTKYVVSGTITAPSGQSANLTTVWIVEAADPRPRLVTAYPGERS